MKKFSLKAVFATVCVVAASVSGFKAYNMANKSETSLLLAENIEALSAGETNVGQFCVDRGCWWTGENGDWCYFKYDDRDMCCGPGWE